MSMVGAMQTSPGQLQSRNRLSLPLRAVVGGLLVGVLVQATATVSDDGFTIFYGAPLADLAVYLTAAIALVVTFSLRRSQVSRGGDRSQHYAPRVALAAAVMIAAIGYTIAVAVTSPIDFLAPSSPASVTATLAFLTAVLGVVILATAGVGAAGLIHGSHRMMTGIATGCVLVALTSVSYYSVMTQVVGKPVMSDLESLGSAMISIVLPLVVSTLLMANRKHFMVPAYRFPAGATRIEVARVRALLRRHGSASLSHMSTWTGNSYWFSTDGEQAVAYRIIRGVAITVGEPICSSAMRDSALREFAIFCDDNGLRSCFYGVTEACAPYFTNAGWNLTEVATESVLRPQAALLAGKRFQDIRTSINRARKSGVHAIWTRFDDLPADQVAQIRDLSLAWVHSKKLPEMGFTLGGLEQLDDPDVRLMLALDDNDVVHAVTSWLPSYRDGAVVSWALDFMRRSENSMPGVIEFLIAASLGQMKQDGIEIMSLSAAPLARSAREQETTVDRVLNLISSVLEPAYGFRSLAAFKDKFEPEHEPLFMAVKEPHSLPLVGSALVRAYLPELRLHHGIRMLQTAIGDRRRTSLPATR
jgi:lysylphosphatidylglycerol synthetase-like protein (DUF2156 family)